MRNSICALFVVAVLTVPLPNYCFGLMPTQKLTVRQIQLALWGCCCLLFLSSSLLMAEASSLEAYRTLETRYAILQYRSLEDLEDFGDEIDYSGGVFSNRFSSSDADDLQVNAKNEADALYRRVQKILDMRKKMNKVIIQIHRNSEEIKRAYTKTYGRGRMSRLRYIENCTCDSIVQVAEDVQILRSIRLQLCHDVSQTSICPDE